jgi:hypothetical protein
LIRLSCDCGQKFTAHEKYAGRRMWCRVCDKELRIPDLEQRSSARTQEEVKQVTVLEEKAIDEPPRPNRERSPRLREHNKYGLSLGNWIALILIVLLVGLTAWFPVATMGRDGLVVLLVVVVLVVWVLLPAYLASYLGGKRSIGSFAGFVLGLLLGWLGFVIVLIFPYQGPTKKCPYCAERVKTEARVCKHCGRDFAAGPGAGRQRSSARLVT